MEQLPTEIIREVCGAICRHCTEPLDLCSLHPNLRALFSRGSGLQALANLCLTSSRMRAIAQPFLYHRLSVYDSHITHSESLLTILMSRPDLGRAAKHLLLGDARGEGETVVDEEIWPRSSRPQMQAGLGIPDDWIELFEPQQLLMHQILVHAPRIEVLALQPSSLDAWVVLPPYGDPIMQPLPALRKLVLDLRDGQIGYDLSSMDSLVSLAVNIDTLIARKCIAVSCPLSLHNVTSLVLGACWISTDCMSRLLSSCGKLNTFAYGVGPFMLDEGIPANVLVRILEEQGHGRTLRRLSLGYSENLQEPPIDSLASFSQLQELWLEYVVIEWPEDVPPNAPAGVLPASLREIGLYDRFGGMASALGNVAAEASNGFLPALKKIAFHYAHDVPLGNLGRRFQQLDIACSYHYIGQWEWDRWR
ncbi:hypothetical protein F4859DRAFT_476353 [Xylaria cf. heliscus]|nr:hypothetical protein F4859DRAFT_476353 [Xylaria cf. heliscus]